MEEKLIVRGVSYLNTLPLLYGLRREPMASRIQLDLDYPERVARDLISGKADIGLVPAAMIPQIEGASIVGNYGIAAHGPVASVGIFSQVPLDEVQEVYLDYQSRTSVALAEVLMKQFWKKSWNLLAAPADFISRIQGPRAGVIIGDRALKALSQFPFHYDLAEAWKQYTGMPFVFAAWVSRRVLSEEFVVQFNEACALGLTHITRIVEETDFPHYNLLEYFTKDIHYFLDENKQQGLSRFLSYLEGDASLFHHER